MVYFISFCMCVWLILLNAKSSAFNEDIDVVVLLPKNNSYMFSISMVTPAIEYAKKSMKSDERFNSGFNFNVHYENSDCGNEAFFNLVDRSFKNKPDLILGPVCEYAASPVARLASHWNIPVITAGALATGFRHKAKEFTQLTRVAPSYLKSAETFSAMFRRFNWKNALLIYADDKEERNCYFALEGVHSVLTDSLRLDDIEAISVQPKDLKVDSEEIIKYIYESQVVIMCAGGDIIRDIMLAAHREKLTNGSNVYFSIELFNSSSYGDGSWKRGDKYDTEAKQAYAALNVLTLLRTEKPEFTNFSIEVMRSIKKAGVCNCENGDNPINMFVEGFHDALLLYALALTEVTRNGSNKKDGRQITQRMWNRTFEGIAGQVSIDDNGDRVGDFSLMAMTDPQAGTFKAVINYLGVNGSLQILPGFNGERFALRDRHRSRPSEHPDKSCGPGISTVLGIVVGALLGTTLLMAFYFFRKNYRITIERRALQDFNIGKHRQLQEESIRSNFSMA